MPASPTAKTQSVRTSAKLALGRCVSPRAICHCVATILGHPSTNPGLTHCWQVVPQKSFSEEEIDLLSFRVSLSIGDWRFGAGLSRPASLSPQLTRLFSLTLPTNTRPRPHSSSTTALLLLRLSDGLEQLPKGLHEQWKSRCWASAG